MTRQTVEGSSSTDGPVQPALSQAQQREARKARNNNTQELAALGPDARNYVDNPRREDTSRSKRKWRAMVREVCVVGGHTTPAWAARRPAGHQESHHSKAKAQVLSHATPRTELGGGHPMFQCSGSLGQSKAKAMSLATIVTWEPMLQRSGLFEEVLRRPRLPGWGIDDPDI